MSEYTVTPFPCRSCGKERPLTWVGRCQECEKKAAREAAWLGFMDTVPMLAMVVCGAVVLWMLAMMIRALNGH